MATNGNNNTEGNKYLRMTLNERVQHFFLLSSFITLVITGFALKFPESLWVTWIRLILGEGAFGFRGDLHRIAAVLMVAVSLYHLRYIIFTKRGREFVADMWFKKTDITDITKTLKYYFNRSKEHPKYRRFSYIEKMEYWAVVWGTVIMGATGSVLWFENTFMPVISNSGMDIATAIHYYEAILASLAILVWHFYFVIFNPDVYPMNKAWFTGTLSKEEMELEHPLWLEEIENAEKEKAGELSKPEEKINMDNAEVTVDNKNKDADIADVKTVEIKTDLIKSGKNGASRESNEKVPETKHENLKNENKPEEKLKDKINKKLN
jgi:formate dehydrogenase gamma subunit